MKTGSDGTFTPMNTGVLDALEFSYPYIELQDRFGQIACSVEGIKSHTTRISRILVHSMVR